MPPSVVLPRVSTVRSTGSTSMPPNMQDTRASLQAIAALVSERTGLDFTGPRWSLLERGVGETMNTVRAQSVAALLHRLQRDEAVLHALVARSTVGETYFLRDSAQLEVVQHTLVPRLLSRRPPGHRLRMWSAGCASGEEAYTLAMLASEMRIDPQPFILGTDISRPALIRAARARFSEWSLRALPAERVASYFDRDGSEWVLRSSIVSGVTLAPLNLADQDFASTVPGAQGMDLILCRNVLIYFGREQAQSAIARLLDALSDGGYLVLGVADPLPLASSAYEPELTEAGVVLRRLPRDGSRRNDSVLSRHSGEATVAAPARPAVPPAPLSSPHSARVVTTDTVPALERDHVHPSRDPVVAPASPITPPTGAEADRTVWPDMLAMELAYAEADYGTAKRLARQLLRTQADARPAVVLVRALANGGLLDDAARWCDLLLGTHRECAELYCLQATFLLDARHAREAVTAARAALYLDRSLAVGHLLAGRALLAIGDVPRAAQAFRQALRLLDAHPAGEPVPAADGEPVATLQWVVRDHLTLLGEAA